MKNFLTILLFAATSAAQDSGRAVVRSTGQYDVEGNVLYSVYVASRNQSIEDVTIAAALPPGTRFLDPGHKPAAGVYEGVRDNIVYWRLPRLAEDTLIGPFVFRAKPDGSGVELPATIQAAVAYQRPVAELIESPAPSGTLVPLAERGSIVVDARGTLDTSGQNAPVPVGATGVLFFVPEGAVDRRVTITVSRVPIDESKLPKTDPATWWCAQYRFETDPMIEFSKQISFALPTRRPVTPGLTVSGFFSRDQSEWTLVPPSPRSAERAIGFGFQSGGCVSQFGNTACFGGFGQFGGGFGGFGGFGAFGYVEQDNITSQVSGAQLGTATTAASTLTNPPSIIAILIGRR